MDLAGRIGRPGNVDGEIRDFPRFGDAPDLRDCLVYRGRIKQV